MDEERLYKIVSCFWKIQEFDSDSLNCHDNITDLAKHTIAPIWQVL